MRWARHARGPGHPGWAARVSSSGSQPAVHGRSLSGLRTAQRHLIRSPATSNARTETVAPSWRFDATSSTSDSVLSLVASHLISRPTRGAFSSRTVPIPVDTNKLTITCTKAPRPRVLNRDTGEIKTDKKRQHRLRGHRLGGRRARPDRTRQDRHHPALKEKYSSKRRSEVTAKPPLSSEQQKHPGAIFASGHLGWSSNVVRGGVEPPTFRFSGGRSYQLSYLT